MADNPIQLEQFPHKFSGNPHEMIQKLLLKLAPFGLDVEQGMQELQRTKVGRDGVNTLVGTAQTLRGASPRLIFSGSETSGEDWCWREDVGKLYLQKKIANVWTNMMTLEDVGGLLTATFSVLAATTIGATTGNITTVNATTIATTNLTVGGQTVQQIADPIAAQHAFEDLNAYSIMGCF